MRHEYQVLVAVAAALVVTKFVSWWRRRRAEALRLSPLGSALDRVLGVHIHESKPSVHLDFKGVGKRRRIKG